MNIDKNTIINMNLESYLRGWDDAIKALNDLRPKEQELKDGFDAIVKKRSEYDPEKPRV